VRAVLHDRLRAPRLVDGQRDHAAALDPAAPDGGVGVKIGLVSDFFVPRIGGLELQMRDLARELTARGHEVVVFTATPGEPTLDGIRVERIGGLRLPMTTFIVRMQEVRELERRIVAAQLDVLHCHSAFSPLALAAAWIGRQHGIPSLLTEHSVLRGLGYAMLDAAERALGWSAWPDVVSAVSGYLAGEMRRVTRGREVRVLPNGVNLAEWTLAHEDSDPPTVVGVMRFMPRKRPIDIVRMIPKVNARLQLEPRFILVGDGPEMGRVRREAERLGVMGQLELPGWQPREQVKKILSRASVFVLPTSKEALSIATLEALAAGVPAVAYDHGGVGDIITDGREGFLAINRAQFIDRVVQLCGDRALRQRMAAQTRTTAARFSWDAVIARHLALYQLAAERRGVALPIDRAAA
jgi:glycosyltransferase involved in cell wall biosynthesis